ncbi:MAG TPA: TonB-dependent receptor [Candidatus Polarisedimenticolia bacterium]|nr:TonB-dependent receptor [Candidatus Polarisedimenticolia bacterium]
MRKLVQVLMVGLLLLSLGSGNAFAQATASGTIQGTVTDQTSAVVSGAQVEAKNKATGVTRTTTSNETGVYQFELLPVGIYTVKVTKSGFAGVAQTIEILIGQTATVNVELKTGSVSEIIEVTGEAPLVDQLKTGVSQDITPKEVEELPMVGRDVANLAYLAPGVKATDSYDPTKNRYAILSVNGENGRNVNVTVNGVDNKDNTVGGPVMQLPLEAVQEFKISTQRFSAENGRSEGAAINMITKQGTNIYHGSLFGYFRDSTLDTNEKVPDGRGGQNPAHPSYSRQQFGGSVGGPVRKDKLFGFFALEREREHQGLEETGTSFDELTFAANAGLAAQPASVIPRPFFETRYNGRMDWLINAKNTAYISYNSQVNDSLNDQSDGTGDLTNGNFTKNHLLLGNFTLNTLISNTTVNQFTFGYQYWNNLIDSHISAPLVTFPSASFGTNTNVPQQSIQKKWQFRDDFSKTIGHHTLKTGVDYIWNPVSGGFFKFSSTLEIDFAADPSQILADKTTYPNGFASAGAVTGMTIANGDPTFLVATKQLGLYFQDDWRVSRRLTLNLGLRWDKDFNMIGGSDIKNSRTYQALIAFNNPISNPFVSRIAHDDNKDFSPRVGFAYDLTGAGRHVLRGGYGLYFGNVFQNIPLFMEQMSNPTVFQTVLSLTSPGDSVPGTGLTLGQWQYGVSPLPTIPPPSATLAQGSVGRLMDPDYRNPVTEEFNIGYSWALNQNSVLETEYTHVLGLHENKTINIDQRVPVAGTCCTAPLNGLTEPVSGKPQFASVRNEESIGRSHYDGMNISFRQRMTRHFSVNANYTLAWAYSYDGGGGSFRNYPRVPSNPFASYEWGPSPNDERHHITLSGIVDLPKGFQLSPIMQFGSARPYNLTNSGNTLNTGGGSFNAVVVPTNDPTNYLAFSGNNSGAQNCFYGLNGVAQGCTIAKYDPLRGDPFFELDMRLAKNFKLGERMNLQLVAQAFNLTNRANYGNDFNNSIANTSTFGHPAGFINPASTIVPLAVWGEFGARFTF